MSTQRSVLYYGNTLEEYEACKELRAKSNYIVTRNFAISGTFILVILASFVSMLRPFLFLYSYTALGMLFIGILIKQGSISYTFLAYMQMLLLYALALGLALTYSTERGTVAVIMMPLLTAVIIDRIDRITVFNTIYTIIYCFLIVEFKDPRLVGFELFSIIVSLVLATFAHYFVQSNIMKGMLSELKNRELIKELNAIQGKLQLKSETDGLTGLFNHEAFVNHVQEKLRQEQDGISALCILDLDGFKKVNDTYGHQHGDKVLTAVSTLLKNSFRPSDMVGRVGGDEFMVFLSGLHEKDQVEERMERILQGLNETSVEMTSSIQCCIGIALVFKKATDFETLYFQADRALYTAKESGRNQICFYDRKILC